MFAHPSLEVDFLNHEAALNHQKSLAPLIDSTLLKPDYLESSIESLTQEATQLGFRAICIPPSALPLARTQLGTSPVLLCTVAGFPLGYQSTSIKCAEVSEAIQLGAVEIDFVQNIAWLKGGMHKDLHREMSAIVAAAEGCLVKVILETAFLTPLEISTATEIAFEAGVHIIKTSTGYASRGASVDDVKIIQARLQELDQKFHRKLGIKASGGIKDFKLAFDLVSAGATRLGTSSGKSLLEAQLSGSTLA
ncbi:MAG: deoxyribose-phosphate aldolase [Pseudomonadota bacterium]